MILEFREMESMMTVPCHDCGEGHDSRSQKGTRRANWTPVGVQTLLFMDLEARNGFAFCPLAIVSDVGLPGCCKVTRTQGTRLLFPFSTDTKAFHLDFVTLSSSVPLPSVCETR